MSIFEQWNNNNVSFLFAQHTIYMTMTIRITMCNCKEAVDWWSHDCHMFTAECRSRGGSGPTFQSATPSIFTLRRPRPSQATDASSLGSLWRWARQEKGCGGQELRQLSTSRTSSQTSWKRLFGWHEFSTEMFSLRSTKQGFYCSLLFCSLLRPASVVASSGRPSLRRDC